MLFNKFYRSETFWLKIIRQIIVYEEVLVETEKLLHDQGDLLNSTKLLFYQGWAKIISGSLKSGKQNCEQAISIFRILKQPALQRMYEEMLQGIMINQANQEDFIIFS